MSKKKAAAQADEYTGSFSETNKQKYIWVCVPVLTSAQCLLNRWDRMEIAQNWIKGRSKNEKFDGVMASNGND